MSAIDWTPDQPLRADATDEQVRQRQYWIPVDGDETDVLIAVARELQAATKAESEAKRATLTGVTSTERNEVVADLRAILEAQGEATRNTHHLAPITVSRQKFEKIINTLLTLPTRQQIESLMDCGMPNMLRRADVLALFDARTPVTGDEMSGRRCRVQGESYRMLDEDGGKMIHIPSSTIPWEVAELAYPAYCANGGSGQSLERLNERGGWGRGELLWLLDGGRNAALCTKVPRYNPDRPTPTTEPTNDR